MYNVWTDAIRQRAGTCKTIYHWGVGVVYFRVTGPPEKCLMHSGHLRESKNFVAFLFKEATLLQLFDIFTSSKKFISELGYAFLREKLNVFVLHQIENDLILWQMILRA